MLPFPIHTIRHITMSSGMDGKWQTKIFLTECTIKPASRSSKDLCRCKLCCRGLTLPGIRSVGYLWRKLARADEVVVVVVGMVGVVEAEAEWGVKLVEKGG